MVITNHVKDEALSPMQKLARRLYGTEASINYLSDLDAKYNAAGIAQVLGLGSDAPLNFKTQSVTLPKLGAVMEHYPDRPSAFLSSLAVDLNDDATIKNVGKIASMSSDGEDTLTLPFEAEFAPEELVTKNFSNAKTTGRLLVENMKAHPFKTAGGALLGGANVAGLFDNDKIIGQAAGLGAGGLAAKYLLPKLGVGGIANGALAVMGGGALGSLFDKLMAKKEAEQAAMQAQYAGQY